MSEAAKRMEREKKEQEARKDKAKKSLKEYKKPVTGPSRASLQEGIDKSKENWARTLKKKVQKKLEDRKTKETSKTQEALRKAGVTEKDMPSDVDKRKRRY